MSPLDKELWGFNTPVNFWLCQEDLPDSIWQEAYARSSHLLELTINKQDIDSILALTLGEGRFSSEHWELGPLKRAYYLVKSLIPRPLRRQLRQIYNRGITTNKVWPIEHRYVDFLWEVMRQVLDLSGLQSLSIKYFWPDHNRYAFILTHDIETAAGQDFVEVVADLEESLGFYSSFNFVPEKYHLNY